MTKPKRQHELILRLRFDKPCTAKEAIDEAKNNIHGNFYTENWFKHDKYPEEFKVKSFKHLPRAK